MALRAGFRRRGYDVAKADVLDLSETGFRVDSALTLGPGSEVVLRLPGLEAKAARVVWAVGFEAGCEFETPLYGPVLEAFLRRHGGG